MSQPAPPAAAVPPAPPIAQSQDTAERFGLEHAKMNIEAGMLGRIFGSSSNAPTNTASLILVALTAVLVFLVVRDGQHDSELLKVIVPIFTLALGFLFGKGGRGG